MSYILDAKNGVVGDETLDTMRKIQGRDKNWQTTARLRSTPEVIEKRLKKTAGTIRQLANPINSVTGSAHSTTDLHARIAWADESGSGEFRAHLDKKTPGFDYKKTKKAFKKSLPLRFHAPAPSPTDKLRRGKELGEINADMDDQKQRIVLSGTCADEDEAEKIQERAYTHLKVEHDEDGKPNHVSLSNSVHAAPEHHMKLAKIDGTEVDVPLPSTNACGPMVKRDGSLDPFRIHRRREIF